MEDTKLGDEGVGVREVAQGYNTERGRQMGANRPMSLTFDPQR